MSRRERARGRRQGRGRYVLLTLYKEGPLTSEALERKSAVLSSRLTFISDKADQQVQRVSSRRRERASAEAQEFRGLAGYDIGSEVEGLVSSGMVRVDEAGMYQLTDEGRAEAERSSAALEMVAHRVESSLLSPAAAARNTVGVYLVLAVTKLIVGFLAGSLALIADGTDASIDTASACVIWAGVKFKKELLGTVVILAMMFATAASVGYEAVNTTLEAVAGTLPPMTAPYLVIAVGIASAASAYGLSLYLRFVGRRNGSLALISQSIDAKNSVYIAIAVVAGAVFSIFGIHFVDALVGGFVAVRIFIDGVGLTMETYRSMRGKVPDLSKYELPFEKQWNVGKLEAFKAWILYSIGQEGMETREEIVRSLEKTYSMSYVPFLSELNFGIGQGYDFDEGIDGLVRPLLDEGYVTDEEGRLRLTEKGRQRFARLFKNARYRRAR